MSKDINIHIKTPGAQQAKQQLDSIGKSSKQVGQQTAAGHKQAAAATEKTTQKLTGMGRILGGLKTQVMGFFGAWLGFQGVQKVINWLIEKLERIAQLQKQIYEKSLNFAQIGQALEMQTGTRGMQQYWAQQAAKLQAAGGLAGPGVSQQMMVSADIAFNAQGGIKSPQVLSMLTQLAPFVGAQQMAPQEVAKLFEFAGTAGIAPTPKAYKGFFAKLQAGYTASKATDFGQYLLGLQKGVTPYMAMGGTLEQGISAFVGARAVSPNEALAATLVEQVTRLASGAYERPRKAMESALGVQWEDLSMDERTNALLRYVGSIPESRRGQVLAAQGFPIDLTTRIGTMVSPEAIGAMGAAGRAVGAAGAPMIDQLAQDYLQSVLGQERKTEGDIALKQIRAAPKFANWLTRIKMTRAEHEILVAEGRDSLVIDRLEPYVMAYEQMLADLDELEKTLPEDKKAEADELRSRIQQSIALREGFLLTPGITQGMSARAGYKYAQELKALQQAPTTINIHNSQDQHFYPRVGDDKVGPRSTPP